MLWNLRVTMNLFSRRKIHELADKDKELQRLRHIFLEMQRRIQELAGSEITLQDIEGYKDVLSKLETRMDELERKEQEVEVLQAQIEELSQNINNNKQETSLKENSNNTTPKTSATRKDSQNYYYQHQDSDTGQLNQEYLKNVILKLFCYIAGNNMKEAEVVMNAVSIMLKMTPEDREKIEEARRNSTLWGSTKYFLKDKFGQKEM